jgi:hypothetical protein
LSRNHKSGQENCDGRKKAFEEEETKKPAMFRCHVGDNKILALVSVLQTITAAGKLETGQYWEALPDDLQASSAAP